jgi:hypothetical protein
MTLSVIDPINLRYRDVIAAKKGTCEPVPNNLVTANKISPWSKRYERTHPSVWELGLAHFYVRHEY